MKNFLRNIFIAIYAIIAIIVTILLLSFNEYKCSEINGNTLYIVTSDIGDRYKKGDLLVIEKSRDTDINIGDEIFLYKNITSDDYDVIVEELIDKEKQGARTLYTVSGNVQYDSEYTIGKVENTKVFHYLGTFLGIIESRWGYLFLVVIVTLLLFLQEIYELVMEIKYGNDAVEGI